MTAFDDFAATFAFGLYEHLVKASAEPGEHVSRIQTPPETGRNLHRSIRFVVDVLAIQFVGLDAHRHQEDIHAVIYDSRSRLDLGSYNRLGSSDAPSGQELVSDDDEHHDQQ